jgi:hypothetical protein
MSDTPPCPLCGTPMNLRRRVAFDGISVSTLFDCPDCLACVQAEAPIP